ncbi:MAG: hypothetical protein MUE94_05880 [Verrucomicrobia bacterium]|nr:hypothetical protein [Verrucomicrobiota bacterium]
MDAPAGPVMAPASGHPEFLAIQLTTTRRLQNRVHRPAQVRSDADPVSFQRAMQNFGKRGTAEQIHAQFRHALRQPLGRQWMEQNLLPAYFPAAPPGNHQQPRRRIEDWRNTFLHHWDGNRHKGQWGNARASPARERGPGPFPPVTMGQVGVQPRHGSLTVAE